MLVLRHHRDVPEALKRPVECLAQNFFISAPTLSQHAKDRGWVEDDDWDPFSRCRIARVRRKETIALTISEYRHLMNAIQRACPDAYAIFLAAGQTGWRAGDLTHQISQ